MTPEQLEHTLAAGKGDHPRQRGRQWERFRRGYERIRWGSGDAGANRNADNNAKYRRPDSC